MNKKSPLKILLPFLFIALCTGFSSCSAEQDETPRGTLTVAVVGEDAGIREWVELYDREARQYDIELVDYAKRGGVEALTKDARAGKAPDIFWLGGYTLSPSDQEALCVDLLPLLDGDPQRKREDYLPSVWEAALLDGQLFALPVDFQIETWVMTQPLDNVQAPFTMAEAKQLLPKAGKSQVFSQGAWTREELLAWLARYAASAMVDVGQKQCSLIEDGFTELLIESKAVPETVRTAATADNGLLTYYILDRSTAYNPVITANEDSRLIGAPVNTGAGSLLSFGAQVGIFSSCDETEAAWEFVRLALSDDVQESCIHIPATEAHFQSWMEALREEASLSGGTEDKLCRLVAETDAVSGTFPEAEAIIAWEAARYYDGLQSAEAAVFAMEQRIEDYLNSKE